MNNFTLYTPTKVVFGKNTEGQTGALVKDNGGAKVLVHFGGSSAVRSGLLERVCASLDAAGLESFRLGGVVPNPRLSLVREGIAFCRDNEIDFILAVGGGSVIDSAKAIAYGIADNGDVWDFYTRARTPKTSAPVGCVLTIAATGSEMSDSSVITNEDGWLKRGCTSDICRPKFAVMNPELTLTLPWYQIASGAVDIVMHTLERWFDTERVSSDLTDTIASGLIQVVMRNAPLLKNNSRNYDAAAELMWASSLSHNGLTACGGGAGRGGDWACHQLEHELGGMFDVTHGAGLAAVWGSWARFVCNDKPERFTALARLVFGLKRAADGIEAMENFFRSLGMPTSLSGLGLELTDEQITELARKCSFFGTRTVGGYRPLDPYDMEEIFRRAK